MEVEEGLCELYIVVGYFEKVLWYVDNVLRINFLFFNYYFIKVNIYYLKEDYIKVLECIEIFLSINFNFVYFIVLK